MSQMIRNFSKFYFDSQFTFLPQERISYSFENFVSLSCDDTVEVDGVRIVLRQEKWDSNRLGKTVCRIIWMDNNIRDLNHYYKIIDQLRDYDCYYLRLNQEHDFCKFSSISCSHSLLWHLATKVSMFSLTDATFPSKTGALDIVDVIAENNLLLLIQVIKIAAKSFPNNRFANDPHFSVEFIEEMYASWIEQECNKPSSRLYAIVENNKVQAFALLNIDFSPVKDGSPVIFVSLIATCPECREQQIGRRLLVKALSMHSQNSRVYSVANTEIRNFSSINFFITNGFRIQSVLNEYHLWHDNL